MEELYKKVIFDRLALTLLQRLEMKVNPNNMNLLRGIYGYDWNKILTTLVRVDDVCGIVDRLDNPHKRVYESQVDDRTFDFLE